VLRVSPAVRAIVAAGVFLAASLAGAQDPLVTLPQAYKLVLENDWVKVVRVHYAPHQKLPLHDHTQLAAAYVYLNDGGPVVFKHDYGAVTRPPTTTGSFRLYRAIKEVHEVDNPNDAPSDFLRVELKTRPVAESSFNGRFHREPGSDGPEKVQFDHPQLRVTRYLVSPGSRVDFAAAEPALAIALTGGRLKVRAGSVGEEIAVETGLPRWLPKGSSTSFENVGTSAVELLRFDLKTEPLAN
jgi:quercetin dioxygenase-like cupin family protein